MSKAWAALKDEGTSGSEKTGNPYIDDTWEADINLTQQPMIGMVSQTTDEFKSRDWFNQTAGYRSYIMDSYVRFIEAQGAKVVPLIWGEPREVTLDKLSKLNGVFLPGGGGDYVEFGEFIFKTVLEYNNNGTFYPLWGTCLGFENLAIWTSDMREEVLADVPLFSTSVPIEFTVKPATTKMFRDFSDAELFMLQTEDVTQNSHSFAVPIQYFYDDAKLRDFWHVTSLSVLDSEEQYTEFVTTVESKQFPVMATMFHTEKPAQGWQIDTGINKTWESIELNTKFIKLFIRMARANPHRYSDFYDSQHETIQEYKLLRTYSNVADLYLFE